MRGFGQSFALLVVLLLVLNLTQLWAVVGFFGGIPMAFLLEMMKGMPRAVSAPMVIFLPGAFAIAGHFMHRFGPNAFRDSVFTLFAAAWMVTTWSILRFFCYFDGGSSSAAAQRCNGLVPII